MVPRGCQAGCCPSGNTGTLPGLLPALLAPAALRYLGHLTCGKVNPSGSGKSHPSFPLLLPPPVLCGISSHIPPQALLAVSQPHSCSISSPVSSPIPPSQRSRELWGSPLLSFSFRSQVKPSSV